MMVMERQKRTVLEPVYRLMKALLPALAISQQNLHRDPGEQLGKGVMDLASQQVSLFQHRRSFSCFRQLGKLNGDH
jgi:hypothetical protein